jgi:hypothetical protein
MFTTLIEEARSLLEGDKPGVIGKGSNQAMVSPEARRDAKQAAAKGERRSAKQAIQKFQKGDSEEFKPTKRPTAGYES